MKVSVVIRLKDEVFDAAGEVVGERLSSLGFSEVKDARVGKLVELEVEAGDREALAGRIEKMCEALLVNSKIEEFKIIGLD